MAADPEIAKVLARLPSEVVEALDALAEQHGTSRNALLVSALRWALAEPGTPWAQGVPDGRVEGSRKREAMRRGDPAVLRDLVQQVIDLPPAPRKRSPKK